MNRLLAETLGSIVREGFPLRKQHRAKFGSGWLGACAVLFLCSIFPVTLRAQSAASDQSPPAQMQPLPQALQKRTPAAPQKRLPRMPQPRSELLPPRIILLHHTPLQPTVNRVRHRPPPAATDPKSASAGNGQARKWFVANKKLNRSAPRPFRKP